MVLNNHLLQGIFITRQNVQQIIIEISPLNQLNAFTLSIANRLCKNCWELLNKGLDFFSGCAGRIQESSIHKLLKEPVELSFIADKILIFLINVQKPFLVNLNITPICQIAFSFPVAFPIKLQGYIFICVCSVN